jgi:hypothetical protein
MKSSDFAELRKANRYRLCTRAFFLWVGQDGALQGGEGVTVDISTCGAFVMADTHPPVGARVQVEIVLPGLEDSSPEMLFSGEGHVLRVERKEARIGFAAALQFCLEASDESLVAARKRNGIKQQRANTLVQQ